MNTLINSYIPLKQPYTELPWNYAGTESVTTVPAGMVDWVLVELRDAATPGEAIPSTKLAGWPKSFFLKSDGSIVDRDGIRMPDLGSPVIANNLYIIIRHRNHIPIMSATGAILTGDVYSFDFTTGLDQAYGGGSGYTQVGSSFAMVTGDIDQDGVIYVSDYNSWVKGFGSADGYFNSDLDMDGKIYVSDYNKWAANFGSSVVSSFKALKVKPGYFSCVPK
jgi:hypothetical protein